MLKSAFMQICWIVLVAVASASAQETSGLAPVDLGSITRSDVTIKRLPVNLLQDQIGIWKSPAQVRVHDTNWMVPFGIATGSLIATDRWVPGALDFGPTTQDRFGLLSNAGLAGFAGASMGTYLLGRIRGSEHQRTAGLLAGEAMVDALAVGEVLKVSFGRERPGEGTMTNKFWHGGNSFPSNHSLLVWSSAAALTEAYPGWGSKMLFYGGASAVSIGRVLANKHAPSDVLVGSTLGYLIGKSVYRRHTVELEIRKQYGSFTRARHSQEEPKSPQKTSVYVPLDSWIYNAFDRLMALGYAPSGIVGLRPWTRAECARLLDSVDDSKLNNSTVTSLVNALRSEFAVTETAGQSEVGAELESVYARFISISGKPLTDSLNFGGTIVNDFGRPYEEGFNSVAGFSARANVGSLGFYVRAEYQHAPGAPALPLSALTAIRDATDPSLPLPPANPTPSVDRLHLLDSYVTWSLAKWNLSFGKQSLWWGPGQNGAMLMSNNADPITMVRLDRTQPLHLPWIFKYLGPIRMQTFMGRLSGHQFVHVENEFIGSFEQALSDQPYIMGQKFSLKPTPNLEIGIARTSVYGGPRFPVTLGRLRTVLFSTSTLNTATNDPGDRRTSFDFTYRIPGLRNWLTLYADSMAEDEINPIAYPRRSAMNPGIYLAKVPKLNRLDFRAEAAYTDLPGLLLSDVFYWNLRYINGYTNKGDLIGNWVGRQGKAVQLTSTYWFSGSNKLQGSYRHLTVNPDTGRDGNQQDYKILFDSELRHGLRTTAWVQYERWNFRALAPTPQSNVSVGLQLTYTPGRGVYWH